MDKKNLMYLRVRITKQTYYNLCKWAAAAGYGEKDLGRVIDKMAREHAIRTNVTRHTEEKET